MDVSKTYVYNKPVSFESQVMQSFMALSRMKGDIERKLKMNKFSQAADAIPKSLKNNFDVGILVKNDRRIWTFKPKQNVSNKVILYMHGGAYIFNLLKYHWNFIEELLSKTNATIVVPDYPLAPNATATDVYNFMEVIYQEYFAHLLSGNLIFMGDSAGAGIALGFAQVLRNKNKTQPAQIILLSPWIDISMSNPLLTEFDKKDKLLGIKGLQMAGRAYKGKLNDYDFMVSPIYGDFSGLGRISVFIGTNDLLIADTKRLKDQLNKEKIPFNYFEYPKMFHAWVIFTRLKESQHAIDQIYSIINNESFRKR